MPYPACVPSCGLPPRTGKRSAAGRSGSIPAVVPDGGINALSGLRSFLRAPPQDRQAQRRRAVRLHTCDSAGWRHKCLIRPTIPHTGSHPVGPRKRSAAGRSGSIPAVVPDGGIHALSGLRSFLRAHPPRTGKRSAAGRSGAVPAIVPDGGINALSGLRSFLRAPPPGPASAAPPGGQAPYLR